MWRQVERHMFQSFVSAIDLECGSSFGKQSAAGVRAWCGCGEILSVTRSPYIDLESLILKIVQT